MPLVSIIIPVYNVRNYVRQCIESIISQSYKNLEIIIVNDGSTDGSIEIVEDIINSDNRIKIINKANGGLSSSRNEGINAAKGMYITFVDADDYIDEKHIEYLVNANEMNNTDISIINIRYVLPNGKCRRRTPKISSNKIVTMEQGLYDLFDGVNFRFHSVNKLYKNELFVKNKIYFPVGRIYEDVSTIYKLFFYSNRISYISATTYNYRQERTDSILGSQFNDKRFDVFLALDEIKNFINTNNIDLDTIYEKMVALIIISLASYLADAYFDLEKEKKEEYIIKLKRNVRKYKINYFSMKNNLSIIRKLRLLMITHMTNTYCILYFVLKKLARYI